MATLSVLKFPTPGGAGSTLTDLEDLQRQELIVVHDAALVTWPESRKKPKTQQLHSLAGVGALSGAFWGMLFGLLFFVPFLGAALGAAMGALGGKMTDVGIDDSFIAKVREEVTPGTSALFLLTSGAVQDRVVEALKAHEFDIIHTNLSAEEEQALRDAFQED